MVLAEAYSGLAWLGTGAALVFVCA